MAVADARQLNQVQYSGRDYPTLRDRLFRRLRDKYGAIFNDFVATSQGTMLVEIVAYALDQVAWYQDRRISDAYLDTARTRAAVARLVEQIGYKMGAASAASTDVAIGFSPALPAAGTLPAGFRCGSETGLTFLVAADQPLTLGMTSLPLVPVREGETRTLTFTSDGSPNQIYQLSGIRAADSTYLGVGTVTVKVDGTPWSESQFLEFKDTEQFEVGYLNDPPTVTFGDSFAGKIPSNGAEIQITFLMTHGEAGNVPAGKITSALDTLVVGGVPITLTVTNANGATGGAEPETATHAQRLAPMSFAARGVAITKSDYEAAVNSFSDSLYGAVSKGSALVVRNAQNDATFMAFIGAIETLLSAYQETVLDNQATLQTQSVAFDAATSQAATDMASASGAGATIDTAESSIQLSVDALRGEGSATVGETSIATTALVDLQDAVDASSATGGEKTTMSTYIAQISALVLSASSHGQNTIAHANLIGTNLQTLASARDAQDAAIAAVTADLAAANAAKNLMLPLIEVMDDDVLAMTSGVRAQLLALTTYTSDLFDADCKANVVSVPILTRDSNGFLAAPSSGLVRRLQEHLSTINEVTQLVLVISGAGSLVEADIVVTFKVTQGFIADEVRASIEAQINDMLRTMEFEQRLNLSDIYSRIERNVVGWSYVNVVITGDAVYLDSEGNLVPTAGKIVTKGSLSVTETA